MRYLCFDIECSDGFHICEFGYVVMDEHFNIIKKKDITINPQAKFHLTGRKNRKDIYLYYSEKVYKASPLFTDYYNVIKSLIEQPNQIIVGHSIGSDAEYLNTACQRYNLPSIDFNFIDSQKVYNEYANTKNRVSLENAEKIFNLDKPQYLHKSDEDALLTMNLIKALCEHMDVTLNELQTLCPHSCGGNKNFNVSYNTFTIKEKFELLDINPSALSNKVKQDIFKKYAIHLKNNEHAISSEFSNKKFTLETSFERNNTKDAMNIVNILSKSNCSYSDRVSISDYYITDEEERNIENVNKKSRLYCALNKRKEGGIISIISFDELLMKLGITREELSNMKLPEVNYDCFQDEDKSKESTKKVASSSIGAIMQKNGIDLSKLIVNE